MAKSVLECNGISQEMVGLVSGIIDKIPWPDRRKAMGEVAVTMLNGSPRLAESIFGWKRTTVELGIHEFQSGFDCVDNISGRRRKKSEENNPKLLFDIQRLVDPHSHADHQLRTDLAHRNVTAQSVRDSLVEIGWKDKELPTTRTISNLLNRHGYRVRSVAKVKVQKKRRKPTPSSSGSGR